jgi:hypothetical protein
MKDILIIALSGLLVLAMLYDFGHKLYKMFTHPADDEFEDIIEKRESRE